MFCIDAIERGTLTRDMIGAIISTMEASIRRGGLWQPSVASVQAEDPLLRSLARAFQWQELIETGRYPTVTALAEAHRVDRSYVRRILTLTTLAPDIVEVILEGREPSWLCLDRLMKGTPMGLAEQREQLGFSAR
jgi:hypothetical protein